MGIFYVGNVAILYVRKNSAKRIPVICLIYWDVFHTSISTFFAEIRARIGSSRNKCTAGVQLLSYVLRTIPFVPNSFCIHIESMAIFLLNRQSSNSNKKRLYYASSSSISNQLAFNQRQKILTNSAQKKNKQCHWICVSWIERNRGSRWKLIVCLFLLYTRASNQKFRTMTLTISWKSTKYLNVIMSPNTSTILLIA